MPPVSCWPVQLGSSADATFRILSTPAVGDLVGGGRPAIAVAFSDGRLYAVTASGTSIANSPASLEEVKDQFGSHVINSSPVMVDVDAPP